MEKYVARPLVFYAEQWWKEGNADEHVESISSTEHGPTDMEGNESGHVRCPACGYRLDEHGIPRTAAGEAVATAICPGTWVVQDSTNDRVTFVSDKDFQKFFERVQ